MNDVTRILSQLESGEASGDELLTAVYEELRSLAGAKMSRERKGHTLQATALVHEAWMSLDGGLQKHWENRRHFFGAAAEAMRRILVNHARKRQTEKRGGGVVNLELIESAIEIKTTPDELLAVHEAMADLEREDSQVAELVKMRYFIGLTMQEAADAMGLKKRTAEGIWQYGRVWLRRRLRELP